MKIETSGIEKSMDRSFAPGAVGGAPNHRLKSASLSVVKRLKEETLKVRCDFRY